MISQFDYADARPVIEGNSAINYLHAIEYVICDEQIAVQIREILGKSWGSATRLTICPFYETIIMS